MSKSIITQAILDAEARMKDEARKLIANRIEHEARRYVRERDLHNFIEFDKDTPTLTIVERLEHKLAASRRKISRGHWIAPGADQMIALRGALLAEQRQLVREANEKRREREEKGEGLRK